MAPWSLWVYLRTLPPVRNAVAESEQKYAALSGGTK
jgi:hypothetical protein